MRVGWVLPLVAACSSPQLTVVLPAMPPSIDRIAVLFLAEDQRVIGATALLARQDPVLTPLPDDLAEPDVRGVWVIGHDLASLAPGLRPDDVTLGTNRLAEARPDDPRLPAPAFAASADRQLDVFDLSAAADPAPSLTADWLSRCPILLPSGRGVVDITCKEIPCRATAEQLGCGIHIDAASCTYGQAEITLDSGGRPAVTRDSQLGTCAVASDVPSGATLELLCDLTSSRQCAVDLYPTPQPALSFSAISLGAGRIDRPNLGHPPAGFVPAIAAIGDQVVTATLSDAAVASECAGVFSRLVFLGGEGPRYAPAPRCLVHLAADRANEAGFIGIFRDPSWTLGRFDLDGTITATVAIEAERVLALEVDAASWSNPEIAVLTERALIFLDARTLIPRRSVSMAGLDPRGVSLRSALAGVADDAEDAIYEVNRGTGNTTAINIKGNNRGEELGVVTTHGADWIITAATRIGGVRVLSPGSTVRVARPYEGFLQPYGIAPWPADARLMVVGLTEIFDAGVGVGGDPNDKTAYLALFDPAGTRFLPGLTKVGVGPIEHIITDHSGHVWATLPWTSTVLRIGK